MMNLNNSPFELTNAVWNAEIGRNTVGAIVVNGVVLVGAAALAYYGARMMFRGVFGADK